MKLKIQKRLAAQILKSSKSNIWLDSSRSDYIKDAITKQDIRDLKSDGVIIVKEIKGKKEKTKKTKRRGPVKIKKNVSKRKQK